MKKPLQPPCGRRKCIPPFGGWRHHLPPHFVVGLWMFSYGAMSLQGSIETYSAPCIGVAREHESHQRTYFEGTQ